MPGLGTLAVTNKHAEADFLNKSINAPSQIISFDKKETEADMLVDYIVATNNCSVLEAIDVLSKYCNNIKQELVTHGKAVIDNAGYLIKDTNNAVVFEQTPLPDYFQPPVIAEKVIHPDATHTMLVGDKETTNVQMTEYYTDSPATKNYWWVWAIILFVIALAALLIYYNQEHAASLFGNCSTLN